MALGFRRDNSYMLRQKAFSTFGGLGRRRRRESTTEKLRLHSHGRELQTVCVISPKTILRSIVIHRRKEIWCTYNTFGVCICARVNFWRVTRHHRLLLLLLLLVMRILSTIHTTSFILRQRWKQRGVLIRSREVSCAAVLRNCAELMIFQLMRCHNRS